MNSAVSKNSNQSGFSLAEMLISLVLVGVLATIAIPMILTSQTQKQKVAKFKGAVSALTKVLLTVQNDTSAGIALDNYPTVLANRLNAVRTCLGNNAEAGGCLAAVTTAPPAGYPDFSTDAAVELPDGVQVSLGKVTIPPASPVNAPGCDTASEQYATLSVIDWNGLAGPNVVGDDRLVVILSFGSESCTGAYAAPLGTVTYWDPTKESPALAASYAGNAGNVALWKTLFP